MSIDPTAFRAPEDTPTVVAGDRAAPLQFTPGAILGGRYRIVSLIGRGGMGDVYRADDLKLGQTVALKFLAGHGNAQRLYEEVRVGRQVSHPNVCRLYDIAEVDAHLFITMEFVDGEDLASLLRRVGRLSSEKALAVTRDICAGIAAAHEKGVVHRDLKPANVMIDGRGRARVTDFGLAVAGTSTSDSAGTPAYMAPEQLAGEGATTRSDIYALGLVIYEVFTGRRAFEATTTHDLLAREQRGEFTRPSLVTKDVPSAVERVIARCLDPNPDARPSVEQIALELPGGDPLAAAIAAGETPSPAMIAAAADRGELSVAAAWTCLATCVVAVALHAVLASRTMSYGRAQVKSPEVLRERVREVLEATHQNLHAGDSSAGYGVDTQWVQRREGAGAIPIILYAYRQSPLPMTALNFEHRVVTYDPPLLVSGMADVTLESDGHLRRSTIVPPQLDRTPVHAHVDWQPFIRLTGLTGPLKEADSAWASVVDTDEKHAWLAPDGTRIEAASYHGRPVSFDVFKPWATPWRMTSRTETSSRISSAAGVAVSIGFWVAAGLLAMRNLRRGQGDRRGARAASMATTVIAFIGAMFLIHHVGNAFEEMTQVFEILGLALLLGAETWIGYIAIEPLVRRRWPLMLISETRIIAGRIRDPMVGRDVLVGVTAGGIFVLLRALTALMPGASPLQTANLALSGIRYVGWQLGAAVVLGILGPIVGATLIVGLQSLTGNLRATTVLLVLGGAAVMIGDVEGPMWLRLIFGLLAGAAVFRILFRFGVLTYGAAVFVYVFMRRIPITANPDDWYFGRSAFAIALILLIALYGFVTSLGGKRWLPELKID